MIWTVSHVLTVSQCWRLFLKSRINFIFQRIIVSFNCIFHHSRTFKIVQQQNTNADDINEVIYCHRFCEAHQHEHQHQHEQHVPLDLHSELIVLETTECFIIAKEYISSDLISNELIQCNHCSSRLGSLGTLDLI
jgi:hypothetical protein